MVERGDANINGSPIPDPFGLSESGSSNKETETNSGLGSGLEYSNCIVDVSSFQNEKNSNDENKKIESLVKGLLIVDILYLYNQRQARDVLSRTIPFVVACFGSLAVAVIAIYFNSACTA